ncbi:MAG: purine-nucleoside phosphorylase [Planctomycetota bacterium]|nr:purine-nucleoside phosphorylase [Planctomycetota bacterium]MDI6786992.1 purine-nucleoside phosphorylase [Planctomycetota bacterium]
MKSKTILKKSIIRQPRNNPDLSGHGRDGVYPPDIYIGGIATPQIDKAVKYIRSKIKKFKPEVGIILGTGLGKFAEGIKNKIVVPYNKIPGFPISTVVSHKGEMIFGTISNKPVLAMAGRFHYYEGYSLQQVTFPVRVMKALGTQVLIISAAVGSVNADCPTGMVVLVKDHINLLGNNPLIGPHEETFGPRFPDMYSAYDKQLLALALEVCRENNIKTYEAVYAAMTGPNLETPAEYRMLRIIGADIVGMSTVPEVIVGVQSGLRILALSVVTDLATPESLKPVDINEILTIADNAQPHLTTIIKRVIEKYDRTDR